jgi:Subtilase family
MRSNVTVGQRRGILKQATHQLVEVLEKRRMLADVSSASLLNIKDGPLAKGGGALVSIYRDYTKHLRSGGDRYDYQSPLSELYVVKGRDVMVTVKVNGKLRPVHDLIRSMKGRSVISDTSRSVIVAYVPIDQVDDLASQKRVLTVRPNVRGQTASAGSVGNDAERSLKTEFVQPAFGVDGSGQKVGVISDSFDSSGAYVIDQLSGDLPEVDIVQDNEPGTDEGRAMLQLVHDIAPGSDLAFHNVGNSLEEFAVAVRSLREAGSTIIVDDVSFATSPYFGEGVLEKSINDVVDDGAVYLTHQRNTGNAAFSNPTNWVADTENPGGLLNDFDLSNSVDTRLKLRVDQAGAIFLQWDDVYDGTVAKVTADVDFFLERNGTVITSSIDNNFQTGAPYEVLVVNDPGIYDVVIRIDGLAKGAAAPTRFKFSANGNQAGMFNGKTGIEYAGNNSSAVGQSAATGAIAVAAVDNLASNAFGRARDPVTEDFTSEGPVIRVFDENGNRLAQPQTILAPLVSGTQRTNTSVAGFEVFPGTSAAAPNVAAVAALLRQISPNASPEQIKDALVESAKTQPLNGAEPGEWDPRGGYGLVDGLVAANLLNPNIAVPTFTVASVNAGRVSSIQLTFSEPVSGLTVDDFNLTRDGTNVSRFRGGETIRTTDGGTTWLLENLGSATQTLGTYTLTLRNARTDVVDSESNVAAGNVVSFDVTLRKVRDLKIGKLDDGRIQLRFNGSSTGGDKLRIQRATDADFSEGIRNIDVDIDATSYIDSDIAPGEAYFYRVRAVKGGRLGDVASVSIVNGSTGELFVDQSDATFRGGWATYGDESAWLESYARASGTKPLETANTATFTSDDLANGSYFVYVRYAATSKSASNARVDVLRGTKVARTVSLDQTKGGDGWVLVGKGINTSAEPLSVRLTSLLANGSVSIDAVRFLPADEATTAAYVAKKKEEGGSVTDDVLA